MVDGETIKLLWEVESQLGGFQLKIDYLIRKELGLECNGPGGG